ncbi:MAG TPA: thrombospondin type 3 repeat-containing protein, partial [Thermomicrobiales bacterium]|nr:thrombospondin type 3 repeat-containing protein [Thermomicrobiales bacterium]
PEGYSDFVIISPAAQTGGEHIAVLAANSEVDVAIYNLPGGTPPPAETTPAGETGTIRLAVSNCPEGMTAGSYDGTACTIATEDFGVTLTDATGADPLTLDDASLEDEVFTWTNVPFEGSPYTVAETRLPAGYVNATVVGAPNDPETGAAVVELSAENSDVGLTFYNFRAAEEAPVDSDGDGLTDEEEVAFGTDPLNPADPPAPEPVDSDSDGLTDAEEPAIGIDPAVFDSDGDGLGDGSEISTHGTSPLLIDTDGDGIDDGTEINVGTDPLEPASA